MPVISFFHGIKIVMVFGDHFPSHFHVYYGEYEATVSITELEIIKGKLPSKILAKVQKWGNINRIELSKNWERALSHKKLLRIKPLD